MNAFGVLSQKGSLQEDPRRMYVYRHTISFEETNLVGNVYYARHVAWQGRCREMFLREHAPGILDELAIDLRLVTLRASCEYYDELRAFDEVEIKMGLTHLHAHRIGLSFEYIVCRQGSRKLAARGLQDIACMRVTSGELAPTQIPEHLAETLKSFRTENTQAPA